MTGRPAARWLGVGSLLLCLSLRLAGAGRLPVFIDEAIHLAQAREAWFAGAWLHPGIARYLPTWLNALVAVHAPDPLLALRVTSGVFGTLSAAGLLALGFGNAQPWAGVVAAALYAVVPYGVVHDRVGLVDPLLTTLLVWSVVVASRWREGPSLPRTVVLGLLAGGMLLTKPYGALALAVPILFAPRRPSGRWNWQAVAGAFLVAALAATPLWVDLRSVAGIVATGQGSATWADLSESILRLVEAGRWLAIYLTPSGVALAALALLRQWTGGRAPWRVLAVWVVWCPLLAIALALQTAFAQFPRHLLPSVPLLLYVIASEVTALFVGRARWLLSAGLAIFGVQSLVLDAAWIGDPRSAPIVPVDHWQYVTGWPSGYGLREVSDRLRAERRSGPVVVLRDSQWVPLSLGLDLHLAGADVVTVDVPGDAPAWAEQVPGLLAQGKQVCLAREAPAEGAIPVLDLAASKIVSPTLHVEKPEGMLAVELLPVTGCGADRTRTPCSAPTDPDAVELAGCGAAAAVGGSYSAAVDWLSRAHEKDPGDITIRYDLGVVLAAAHRATGDGAAYRPSTKADCSGERALQAR